MQFYTTKQINEITTSYEIKGRILHAAIRRNPFGRYVVSLLVETEVQELPKTHSYIRIDVGLKNFAVLSDGPHKNPKFFQSLEEKLAKAQLYHLCA